MALAILILSTEGGRNSATMIGAGQQEAVAALDAVHAPSVYKFLDVGNPAAVRYVARAFDVLGEKVERRKREIFDWNDEQICGM